MHRRYTDSPTIRKVLQTLWYQVNNGQEIYVVGVILDDGTVRGGTGWGAEFAKLCNKPLFVFDQEKDGWFEWTGDDWKTRGDDTPVITHPHFTGTGTRQLQDNGQTRDRGRCSRNRSRRSRRQQSDWARSSSSIHRAQRRLELAGEARRGAPARARM